MFTKNGMGVKFYPSADSCGTRQQRLFRSPAQRTAVFLLFSLFVNELTEVERAAKCHGTGQIGNEQRATSNLSIKWDVYQHVSYSIK